MTEPRFMQYPDQAIELELRRAGVAFNEAMRGNRPDAAFAEMAALLEYMLGQQEEGRRLHKGVPLHTMGLAKLYSGELPEALRYTAWAFVEDALSRGDEDPTRLSEIDMPAAHNLVFVFNVPGPVVAQAARRVRAIQDDRGLIPDPRAIDPPEDLFRTPTFGFAAAQALIERSSQRLPGQFTSVWEDRVFVAGRYSGGHHQRLRVIADEIRAAGLDPVLAEDFVIPQGLVVTTQALLLEHECSSAVFDLTEGRGQLIELDRLRDFPIRPARVLLVYEANERNRPDAGQMTTSWWPEAELAADPFQGETELRQLVRDFCARLRSAREAS